MDTEQQTNDTERKLQVIRPSSIPSGEAFGASTLWQTYSFAPEWFEDALNEARTGHDHHARRREIVFAVCFAESYLVEWVRDEVLNRDFERLNGYFRPGQRMSVKKKWKCVPKLLLAEGLILAKPDLGLSYWEDWLRLVEMRNGVVHARSSRPETHPQAEEEQPLPTKADLDQLAAGWPTRVVVALVRRLHEAVGTATPSWLVDP